MAGQVVHQGKQIEATLAEISPAKALQGISQIDQTNFPKALGELETIARRPVPPEPIPPNVIQTVAQKLRGTDPGVPGYWPAVFQFIDFASQNASPGVPPTLPQVKLSQLTVQGTASNQTVEFDEGIALKDIRFVNCQIIFTGGGVGMENVRFVDSVFYFPPSIRPSEYLASAARAVLASDMKSVVLNVASTRRNCSEALLNGSAAARAGGGIPQALKARFILGLLWHE